jgi:cell division protein FtsL
MMRLINILVIAALIAAATTVYKIKFDSTLQAEKAAKLRNELRNERNAIARLRAEWAKLDTPSRVQALADRHLALKPVKSTQFDEFTDLPPRPPAASPPRDPIGAMLTPSVPDTTGSVPAAPR